MSPTVERVLAIDPGDRCGWARGRIEGTQLVVDKHGITPAKDFVMKLHEVAGEYDTIIYETWRLNAAKAKQFIGSDFPTVQVVGMIRLCAWLNPKVRLIDQGPDLKTTGAKVATAGVKEILARMPKTHDDAHDGDALMHLSYYHWNKYVT